MILCFGIYMLSQPIPAPIQIEKPKPELPFQLSVTNPGFLTYEKAISQMRTWQKEAEGLVDVETYGNTKRGTPLYYLRMNKKDGIEKPKVLIMASIHGNEPLASTMCMSYIGNLLFEYRRTPAITDLINRRDIYFIPMVSPDSFPKSDSGDGMSREVEGVDPNRNFPTKKNPNIQSEPTIKAIEDLFIDKKFDASISGHTWGRLLLKPWGDSVQVTPHDSNYKEILGKMSSLSGYRVKSTSAIYGKPIYGSEVDWFYRNGAFAIVVEYGSNQKVPKPEEIEKEFNRTYGAVILFIDEAAKVDVRQR
jgi:hypothetical protein